MKYKKWKLIYTDGTSETVELPADGGVHLAWFTGRVRARRKKTYLLKIEEVMEASKMRTNNRNTMLEELSRLIENNLCEIMVFPEVLTEPMIGRTKISDTYVFLGKTKDGKWRVWWYQLRGAKFIDFDNILDAENFIASLKKYPHLL